MVLSQDKLLSELKLTQEKEKAMVNEMVGKLTSVCWDKCITSAPGSKFSSSETTCLTNCAQSNWKQYLHRKRMGSEANLSICIESIQKFNLEKALQANHRNQPQNYKCKFPVGYECNQKPCDDSRNILHHHCNASPTRLLKVAASADNLAPIAPLKTESIYDT
ncbi:Mitochondrial import inner membrane translocase subunit [Nymphaea thermarum]|nr:Mitochondrial import inner membrane translocase subunit [Nymphaea thermarum]